MIAKKDLKDQIYYRGKCRNASVALWDAQSQNFVYMRTKFNFRFPETIKHPEDDDGFDLFTPFKECEPKEHERIINGN